MVSLSSFTSLSVYIAVSYIISVLFIFDYASAYGDVFETAVALANSSFFQIMMVNLVIASHCLLWKVVQAIFFGKLFAAELVALKGSIPVLMIESVIVCLLSNPILGPYFSIALLLTFVCRLLHCLSDERLVTLSTLPAGSDRARKVGRLGLFLVIAMCVDYCASVNFWGLASHAPSSAEKGLLYYMTVMFIQLSIRDVRQTFKLLYNQLAEDRTSLFFFVEKFFEIAESLVAICFFIFTWVLTSDLPSLLFQSMSRHMVGLWTNVSALYRYMILSRRVKSLPDAREEDLLRDPVCTICYDQMELAQHCKVLPCGHVYHNDCLRHWFETRGTCPYCRANVLQKTTTVAPAAAAAAAPEAEAPPQPQEPEAPHHEIHEGDQGANPVLTENELLTAYGQYLAFLRQQQAAETPVEDQEAAAAAASPAAVAEAEATTAVPSPPAVPEATGNVDSPPPRESLQHDTRKEAAVETTPLRASASLSSLSPNSSPRRYLATDRRAARTQVEMAFDTFFAEVEEAQNRLLENMEAAFAKK